MSATTTSKTDWAKGLLKTVGATLLVAAGSMTEGTAKHVCLWVGVACAVLGAYLSNPTKVDVAALVAGTAAAVAASRGAVNPTLPAETPGKE